MNHIIKRLVIKLYQIGAIKFGNFKLKLHEKNPDAPLSPIYIDLRLLRSFPRIMNLAIDVFEELITSIDFFDLLADVPTAATPMVAILSHITGIPMISVRMDKKEYGTKARIDGVYTQGQKVLLIDDLITHADSKLEAISILKSHDLVVKDVMVLIDREQSGAKELEYRGYNCISALKLTEILQLYRKEKLISQGEFDGVIKYLRGE